MGLLKDIGKKFRKPEKWVEIKIGQIASTVISQKKSERKQEEE